MIINYKIILEYDGTRYNGWQKQGNTENTIQGKLESTLSRFFNQPIEVNGSGRTDAGVHARGQVASFKVNTDFTSSDSSLPLQPDKDFNKVDILMSTLNDYFPDDIRILSMSIADQRFHARLNAKKKTYRYTLCLSHKEPVFYRKYCMHIDKPLNIDAMKNASQKFIGTHDLLGFSDTKTKKSTTRTIEHITFTEECVGNDKFIHIDFTGDGFLYHTIRLITGTLLSIGFDEYSEDIIDQIFSTNNRKQVPFLAPAKGLTLINVEY